MNDGANDGKASSHPKAARGFLVVGYGNPLRGDDGVGPAVVELLRGMQLPGMSTEITHQLTPDYAAMVTEASTVVFVDALREGGMGGQGAEARGRARIAVRALIPPRVKGVGGHFPWSGHRVSPESVLAWAAAFWGRSPEAWVVAIRVDTLTWGESLSAGARSGVSAAVEAILTLWEDWRARSPRRYSLGYPGAEAERERGRPRA